MTDVTNVHPAKLPEGSYADIGDSHTGTDLAGSDDGMTLVVDFTTGALEGADPLLPVRIDEVTVDARADALFLCGCRKYQQQAS